MPLATHVRSTLVLSSVQSLKTRGYYDRYLPLLDGAMRDAILSSVAGVWMPMNVALAHYHACEALGLSLVDAVAIGHDVGNRIQGSFLGVVVRAAKNTGVTPWSVLMQVGRLWDRTFHGGGGPVLTKLGPKESRVELCGLPLMTVPYFRHAYRGAFSAGLELFCEKVYVNEVRSSDPYTGVYKVAWV